MTATDMPELGALIADVLLERAAPESTARAVTDLRRRFNQLHFVR